MQSTPTVRLRNGTEGTKQFVAVMMIALKGLMEKHPIALYDLHEMAKDSAHQPFGNSKQILSDLYLISDDNSIHESCRNVILSAMEGEGRNLRLTNPLSSIT